MLALQELNKGKKIPPIPRPILPPLSAHLGDDDD